VAEFDMGQHKNFNLEETDESLKSVAVITVAISIILAIAYLVIVNC